MYIGETSIPQESLPGLIKAAECLQMKGLALPAGETNDNNECGELLKNSAIDYESSPSPKRRKLNTGMDDVSKGIMDDLDSDAQLNTITSAQSHGVLYGGNEFLTLQTEMDALKEEIVIEEHELKVELSDSKHLDRDNDQLPGEENVLMQSDHQPPTEHVSLPDANANHVETVVPQENIFESSKCEQTAEVAPPSVVSSEANSGDSDAPQEEAANEAYGTPSAQDPSVREDGKPRVQEDVCHQKTVSDAPVTRGVKGFVCHLCGKPFGQKIHLQTHVRAMHEDVKNFACDVCQKSFFYNHDLQIHISKLHKLKRKKTCNFCDRLFISKNRLLMHIQTVHVGIKQFPCGFCQNSFASKQALQRHISTVHECMKISV